MTLRTATCHCRRLTLNCDGEPAKVSMCHCTDCQRRTGSLFSIAVFYERDRVSVASGETRQFERLSASGFPVTFNFCPNCGSNLFWEPARMPHLVGVAVGGFEDPAFPRPSQAVWVKDRHDWLDLPNDLPQHAVNPPPGAPAPRE